MPEPTIITSLQNERVKFIRSLEMRKVRRETGLFVAEGAAIAITARDQGHVPEIVVMRSGGGTEPATRGVLRWAADRGATVLEVSEAVLAKLASKDNPQTVLSVFRQRWAAPPEPGRLAASETWLALEAVRDPGNLGTIVRTADAVGASGILLVGACCDAYSREAVRASMGSIFAVPLVRLEPAGFLDLARRWPGDVVGAHLDGGLDFRHVAYRGPSLLVMGSEGPGLTREATAVCHKLVRIPMAGRLDSLNLSIATALALYQIRSPHLQIAPPA